MKFSIYVKKFAAHEPFDQFFKVWEEYKIYIDELKIKKTSPKPSRESHGMD
jgi:hypothetical protein